ncbi:MAG: hypothetical protein ACE5KE_13515, partial [Methanosarcinales archaeon]
LKFIENFFMQYLAFKNKDPKLLTKKLTIDDLVAMVESSGDEGLQSVVDGYKSHVKYNDYAGLLEVAIYAPETVAGINDEQIIVMFDEFQRVDEMTLKGEPYPAGGAFGEVVESTRAPYLVSGSSMTLLNKTLSNDCFFMRFDRFKLDPLEDHDAYELVKRLSNYFKVKVSEKTAAMIIGKCKGNPFYIKCIFQQANKQKSNLETKEEVDYILSIELSSGFIWFDWDVHLEDYFDKEKTIKLLNNISDASLTELELARHVLYKSLHFSEKIKEVQIATELKANLEDVKRILKKLHNGDFLNNINGYYSRIEDPFLHEYIISQYKRIVEHEPLGEVQKSLENKLVNITESYASIAGIVFEKCVEDLLKKWTDKDYVSTVFFDYEKYKSLTPEELEFELQNPKEKIRLTKMNYVEKNYFIQIEEGKPAKEIDVYGSGLQKDSHFEEHRHGGEYEVIDKTYSVTWLVDIRFRKSKVNDQHLIEFHSKAQAVAKKYPEEIIEPWCISKAGFTSEALQYASEHGIHTSNLEQLNLLFKHFDLGEVLEWAIRESKMETIKGN